MTPERVAARLRKLLRDANAAGFELVADGGGYIRIVTAKEAAESDDLREAGLAVRLNNGCGCESMTTKTPH